MNNLTHTVLRLQNKITRLEIRKKELEVESQTIDNDLINLERQLKMYQDACSHEYKLQKPAYKKSDLKDIRYDLHKCPICGAEIEVKEDISDLQEEFDDN